MKVALITGGAKRIGRAIAESLHEAGFFILLHYSTSEKTAKQLAQSLEEQRPNSVHLLQGDLSDEGALQRLCEEVKLRVDRLDVLVNNASTFYPNQTTSFESEAWHQLVDVNLKAPYQLSTSLQSLLEKHNGCIINMIDIHANSPLAEHSIYCTSKAGLAMLTKSLAKEFAPKIRVNGIAPGAILWPEKELDQAQKEFILAEIPMHRLGSTDDIVHTVQFLVNQAPYITGQIIAVDGGRSL
ncbi:pteridine reductase [Algicola sagamiensis]|uniref:pteridine reductase n=1 Tax=Algicola sagamiensis TaxID=163869 RepID=UPI00037E4DD4|nr:pteridine reductase [Algicola sagamiensis]